MVRRGRNRIVARFAAGLIAGVVAFAPACASGEAPAGTSRSAGAIPVDAARRMGPRDLVDSFVGALNRMDAEAAANCIDWETWVAGDPALIVLVDQLRKRFADREPTPADLASKPVAKSSVTLGEILDERSSAGALARAARERFVHDLPGEFGAAARTGDARLLAWNEDSRETSATVRMPDGSLVELIVVGAAGRYRLLPRW